MFCTVCVKNTRWDGVQKKLDKIGIKILSLADLRIDKEPGETGKTFKENAVLKAKYYSEIY